MHELGKDKLLCYNTETVLERSCTESKSTTWMTLLVVLDYHSKRLTGPGYVTEKLSKYQ